MKTIILSLLLFATVSAQNIWYVDRDATGANTGRSWTDAWVYFDSGGYAGNNGINWNIISPGDTIYISGGTDSTVYQPDVQLYSGYYGMLIGHLRNVISFADGDPVVLTKGWETGHNGEVYFCNSPPGGDNSLTTLQIQRTSNLKFVGLNFYTDTYGNCITVGQGADNDSLITFYDCHIFGTGLSHLIALTCSKTTFDNCLIETLENDDPADQDLITGSGAAGGRGGHTITNNILIYRNSCDTTDAHRDAIQLSGQGDAAGNYLTGTIANNLVIDTSPEGNNWNGMMYFVGQRYFTWNIYNNVIVTRKLITSVGGIWFSAYGAPGIKKGVVLNNTLIMRGTELVTPITANIDTLICKNNLIVVDTTNGKFYNLATDLVTYKDIDYNYYARQGGFGSSTFAYNGLPYTFDTWQGTGYDKHSDTTNSTSVTFVNKYGENLEDYYTTAGRDAGVNLYDEYPFLRTDALGNPRPESGGWDIGALEYQDATADTVPSFAFTSITNAEFSTRYIGSAVFGGADSTFHVSSEDSFKVGALSSYDVVMVEAESGDTVFTPINTGTANSTTITNTITAGGISRNFSVRTRGTRVAKGSDGIIWKDKNNKIIKVR